MVDSFVRTEVGAANEPWYASVTKVGHSTASLVILRYHNTVVSFLSSNLRNHNYTPRHLCTFLTEEEAVMCFYILIGQASKSVFSDAMFKPVSNMKEVKLTLPMVDDMGSVQSRKAFNLILQDKAVKEYLSYYATSSINEYLSRFEPRKVAIHRGPKVF